MCNDLDDTSSDLSVPFSVDVVCGDGVLTAMFAGELDLATGPILVSAISPHRGGFASPVFDVGELGFVDVTGLRSVLASVDDHSIPILLERARPECRRLVELAGFPSVVLARRRGALPT